MPTLPFHPERAALSQAAQPLPRGLGAFGSGFGVDIPVAGKTLLLLGSLFWFLKNNFK